MKLQMPFIQLPLAFDARKLADEVAALGDAPWKPHPQGFAGNSMLPLVSVEGDPDDESFTGPMRPTPALERCEYLGQVFASLQATVGRSRLMRLSGHAEVTRHADQGYYWAERVRVHVPVLTQPTVRFECGGAAVNMAAGECWIFDTWRQHRVLNDAEQSRIHLVVDTVGGGGFWDMVSRGRAVPAASRGGAPWTPAVVAPRPGSADFACETVNLPVVMSPWELNSHMGLLLADAVPHPRLAQVRLLAGRFVRQWQGLWFQYGERPEGHAHYREALGAFVAAVRGPGQGLALNNALEWYGAMMALIGQIAIRDEGAPVSSC